MVYEYNDFLYIHDYGKARLYKANQLLFKGNAWSGILMFLQQTNNAPEVREMFKNQLEQREKPREKQSKKPSEVTKVDTTPTPTPPPKPKKQKAKSIWDDDRRMTK